MVMMRGATLYLHSAMCNCVSCVTKEKYLGVPYVGYLCLLAQLEQGAISNDVMSDFLFTKIVDLLLTGYGS